MRLTTTLALTALSFALVGCNHLSRGKASAMQFDDDPFLPTDKQQQQQHYSTSQQAPTSAAMPLSGDHTFDPNRNQAAQHRPAPNQPAQPATGANVAWQFDVPASNAPVQPTITPGPPGASSPALRAEAQVAAMLAQRHAQQPSGIQQASHTVPANDTAGTARFDYSAAGPAVFEPNPFSAEEVVPTPYQTEIDQAAMPMLDAADLEIGAAAFEPAKQPTQAPSVFPGTNIPIPTGRALLFNDKMLGPAPMAPTGDQQVTPPARPPAFTPPTVEPGQAPIPVVGQAIPLLRSNQAGSTNGEGQKVEPQPAPAQPRVRPIVNDSRSDSKWRATRRM